MFMTLLIATAIRTFDLSPLKEKGRFSNDFKYSMISVMSIDHRLRFKSMKIRIDRHTILAQIVIKILLK